MVSRAKLMHAVQWEAQKMAKILPTINQGGN